MFASASADGSVRLWNTGIGSGSLLSGEDKVRIEKLCFSPDGSRIVTVEVFGGMRVFDTESGQELYAIASNWIHFNQVAYTADGLRIVGKGSKIQCAWDAESGQFLGKTFSSDVGILDRVRLSKNLPPNPPPPPPVKHSWMSKLARLWRKPPLANNRGLASETGVQLYEQASSIRLHAEILTGETCIKRTVDGKPVAWMAGNYSTNTFNHNITSTPNGRLWGIVVGVHDLMIFRLEGEAGTPNQSPPRTATWRRSAEFATNLNGAGTIRSCFFSSAWKRTTRACPNSSVMKSKPEHFLFSATPAPRDVQNG